MFITENKSANYVVDIFQIAIGTTPVHGNWPWPKGACVMSGAIILQRWDTGPDEMRIPCPEFSSFSLTLKSLLISMICRSYVYTLIRSWKFMAYNSILPGSDEARVH